MNTLDPDPDMGLDLRSDPNWPQMLDLIRIRIAIHNTGKSSLLSDKSAIVWALGRQIHESGSLFLRYLLSVKKFFGFIRKRQSHPFLDKTGKIVRYLKLSNKSVLWVI